MYKLYSMQRSGNSYKVRLALALLNAPYRAIEIDILRGESRTPDFLAKNPSGQVPLLSRGVAGASGIPLGLTVLSMTFVLTMRRAVRDREVSTANAPAIAQA